MRGRVSFTVGDETADAPAGTLIDVPDGVVREAVAREEGSIVLAVGGRHGRAFTPHGWDEVVVAFAKARRGDLAGARAMLQALIARQPGEWHAPYNAACFEALAGNPDEAFAALAQAVELDADAVRSHAPGDGDLASLHGDPRWQELVG